MYKLKGMEFTENDLKCLYVNNKYIIKYREVYQINYSKNAGYYLQLIYKQPKNEYLPLTKRGRHLALNANEVNNLVGFELVKSDTYI